MKVRFSTILTRDFLFSRLGASISASRCKFPNKRGNIKRKPLGPGYIISCSIFDQTKVGFALRSKEKLKQVLQAELVQPFRIR